jgi:hypothetical protein
VYNVLNGSNCTEGLASGLNLAEVLLQTTKGISGVNGVADMVYCRKRNGKNGNGVLELHGIPYRLAPEADSATADKDQESCAELRQRGRRCVRKASRKPKDIVPKD